MRAATTPTGRQAASRYLDPFAWLVRSVLWALGAGLLVLLLASDRTARLDHALYDLHMRHWSYTPGEDVVIVAIDMRSLAALGRWPWPRAVHARLIDRLTADGVRGIGMDVTVSEPDVAHPENDAALAAAAARNGRVAFPVFAEARELGGMPEEIEPIPAVAKVAAALGQVDVPIGDDRVARAAYLKAGLGSPYWPALGLALLQLDQPAAASPLPGLCDDDSSPRSPYLWERDNLVLLHYAGPDGSFGRVSYADVLDGQVPPSLLKGKLVLVGATADGMRDIIDTPVGTMPGVEYQANLLETLRRGMAILPLNLAGRCLLGMAMLALPLVLYGLPGLRRAWRAAAVAALACLLLSALLLRHAGLWWPPAACVALILAGAVLWELANRLDVLLRRRSRRRLLAASLGA
ncbi:CHASE2 domain-containing protein [Rhodanobacter sp. PCA2]|uniref:CHASE2 domain-containing protein n=1 Tax=Rhodanobacter sp. PCA2 TaxID=2006117 RepID=UPI0015E73A83|nr:CHASE2 domain-containing protein [Rhodanobacter sp. PCA2]MBA2078207.1 diguanylate cyclase [Rhodanobacter sp. PCA2]